mgnify:FL=1
MMKRDCPHCFERLEKRCFKKGLWSVDTDVCRSCNGLYLDKGELLKLTSNRPLHNITTKYLGVDSDSNLLCPGCGSIMDMESVGGVEIDVCLQCNGVWLDSEELEQLKELNSDDIEKLSPEKLAEIYDANKAVPTSGILSWLFGR